MGAGEGGGACVGRDESCATFLIEFAENIQIYWIRQTAALRAQIVKQLNRIEFELPRDNLSCD